MNGRFLWIASVESVFVSYAPKAKENLTYTGKPQELITKGQGFCGTIKYSLDKVTVVRISTAVAFLYILY